MTVSRSQPSTETLVEQLRSPDFGWSGDALAVDSAIAEAAAARIEELEEALRLAEDVLSRRPFSTGIWPNGIHPQIGIEKIRAALSHADGER